MSLASPFSGAPGRPRPPFAPASAGPGETPGAGCGAYPAGAPCPAVAATSCARHIPPRSAEAACKVRCFASLLTDTGAKLYEDMSISRCSAVFHASESQRCHATATSAQASANSARLCQRFMLIAWSPDASLGTLSWARAELNGQRTCN